MGTPVTATRPGASFALPALATLAAPPTWCNAHGKVDRSACIEIRVSEVRRLAGCVRFKPRDWPHMKKVRLSVHPLPNETSAANTAGRVATGLYTVTAQQLDALHRHRLPRQLAGDRRTTRAAVMRPAQFSRAAGFTHRQPHNAPAPPVPFDAGLDSNPNRGATRTKMIGIDENWSQMLRLEKWIFPHRIRPAYYLICPGTFTNRNPPPLSTCSAGRKATGCAQRALKLLTVQCTAAEFRDAQLAHLWISSIPERLRWRSRGAINRLLQRYAPIMPPRTLLCARCLGVRYGNDPENARQSWRRAQGKDDARPPMRKRKR